MKILQVIASDGLGGREIFPVSLADSMKKLGHNVFLLVRKNSETIPLIKRKNLCYFELKMNGYLNLFSIIPLVKFFKKNKFDIIHTHISKSLFFLNLCRKICKTNTKLIFTHHLGMNVNKNDIFHKIVYNSIDNIVAVSNYVKNRMLCSAPFLNGKIKVIYDGIDFEKFNLRINDRIKFLKEFNLKNNCLTIGLIGQINEGKGHFWLLKAIKLVKKKYKNFKLFIIGKGKLEDDLKNFTKQLSLEEYVIWTGFRWDTEYFYRNLDIVIVPSKSEALGIVLMEAMASKKPVICSNSGAFPEIVKNNINGIIVEYNNENILAQKILYLIKNKQIRKKLGSNARKTIEKNFTLEKIVNNYLKLYAGEN